ncbi:hypothetical protein BGW80DRAFT_148159 [Lactifluus volemus]|nr:hypothetical protein BGW80DRAFT_148159 [Lactifluus volemus]
MSAVLVSSWENSILLALLHLPVLTKRCACIPSRRILTSLAMRKSRAQQECLGAQTIPRGRCHQLTPSTVAKAFQDLAEGAVDSPEANALDLLFAQTTIPVPRVRRVVKRQWDLLITMDYTPGSTLAHIRGRVLPLALCQWLRVKCRYLTIMSSVSYKLACLALASCSLTLLRSQPYSNV